MNSKALPLFGLFFLCTGSLALGQLNNRAARSTQDILTSVVVPNVDNRYAGVTGSPYWVKSWAPGTIVFEPTAAIPKQEGLIKYDALASFIVVREGDRDSTVLDGRKIKYFTLQIPAPISPARFERFPEAAGNDIKLANTFFQVLQEGPVSLLKQVRKTIVKANFTGAYSANRTSDEIVSEVGYYLKTKENKLVKVKLNRKSILENLADKQTELKAFIQKEQLQLQTEEDLAKVLGYYNSL